MSMGIVNSEEFDSELGKMVPVPTGHIEIIEKGRGTGNVQVPGGLRKIIGEESNIEGRESALDLASRFGISPSSVSAYANGAHSTASYNQSTEVQSHINDSKMRVSKRAHKKLMSALSHITDDKLAEAKVREVAGIAKDMSVIIKNMEPDVVHSNEMNKPQFIFYAPQFTNENNFDVVYSKE